ncbi:hypothetical protein [Cellulomonas sp.]|nr:hypothetical protein [Cellulomonas sp.]
MGRRRKTLGPQDIDDVGYAALVGALTFLGVVGAVVLCMTAG